MNPEKYIIYGHNQANTYINGVKDGSILVNKWIKLAVTRYENDLTRDDLMFDKKKVDKVFMFFAYVNINIKNIYKQFDLLPYQAFIILNMFGFYWKSSGKRRYRYSLIWISRKSGKTVFATVLNLYFLIADGVKDPQALMLGNTKEQASLALEYGKSIVLNSPALRKRVNVMQYQLRFDHKDSRGLMKSLASNASGLDGYSPSSVILDEIHAYPDDSLLNVMKSGVLARENPVIMMISTAGFVIDSFAFDIVENCKNILDGTMTDDSMFAVIYTLDDGDDYNDPANWYKSNPGLDSIIDIEDLKIEYNQAINRATELPNFLTKNLNLFVESSNAWIDEKVLKARFNEVNEDELTGMDCYLGMDLSSTRDIASVMAVITNEDHSFFKVIPYFIMPDNPSKKLRKAGIDLTHWIKKGYIKMSQTKTLDYDMVLSYIKGISEKYNVIDLAYDSFNSAMIVPKINELGINTTPFSQTAAKFNLPLKYLEKLIYDSMIDIGTNPVLLWHFRNVVLYIDGNGNIKIMKNKSLDSVDGVVALGMAIGSWVQFNISDEFLALQFYNENAINKEFKNKT